jgi:prolyl-tRNA editing enzyme YbaK/EbsC (Cys-tRNA(Pro) deacylase)
MPPPWPEPVERVAAFLRAAGAEARLEELTLPAPSAELAATAIGSRVACVVESLVFVCEGRPLLALVPGDRRADPAKIARAMSARRARTAEADEVVKATGFEPGGVAPFPLAAIRTVLVERTVLGEPQVWVGGGSPLHLVALGPLELVRLTRAEAADLVQEPA